MAPAFPVVLEGVLLVLDTGVLSLSLSDDLEGVAGTFSGNAEDDIFPSSSKFQSTGYVQKELETECWTD